MISDVGKVEYERYCGGDDGGMVELIRLYRDGLFLFLVSMVGNFHTAEDLTQEVFIKLATKKPHFHGKSSFRTWIFAIGRNLARDCYRKRREIPSEDTVFFGQTDDAAVSELLKQEQKRQLHHAMMHLNQAYRTVLYLAYFEESDVCEIAVILKKSKHSVENQLSRAKAALRLQLTKEGFLYEEL